ncbi:hypothetical protein Tco_0106435 [Tanacetum coccineum]
MDQGAANVSYLLAQYLFRHAEGRKINARLLGGHFIRSLAHYFGLGAERHPVAAAAASGGAEDAPDIKDSGRTYQEFDGTFRGSYLEVFERRTRRRTDGTSTSTTQQEQQPDP